MFFKYNIVYWDSKKEESRPCAGLLFAENYNDAIDLLDKFYDIEKLESIQLKPIGMGDTTPVIEFTDTKALNTVIKHNNEWW